ncbi:MAG: type II secretion system F family protein [Gemmatimonadaceae bacterium]|nr:type II secretion system F family protein [Gemmatimonadaceae bacterium]
MSSVAEFLRGFETGRERAEFYRGWRAGVSAGLAHPTILSTVGASSGSTRDLRAHLLDGTNQGRDIASLVKSGRHLLEPFESALLTLGEESGQLDFILGQLADFHMRQYKLVLAVRKQLSYPMFVSLVAAVLLPLPLVFAGQVAAYFVAAGHGLASWFFVGGSIFAALARSYQRRPAFVRARFARSLTLSISSGLPIGRSALLAAEASGDPALVAHVRRIGERTLVSQPLTTSLAGAPHMTAELQSALIVAEQTGDFATTLGRLADLYEDGFR